MGGRGTCSPCVDTGKVTTPPSTASKRSQRELSGASVPPNLPKAPGVIVDSVCQLDGLGGAQIKYL